MLSIALNYNIYNNDIGYYFRVGWKTNELQKKDSELVINIQKVNVMVNTDVFYVKKSIILFSG